MTARRRVLARSAWAAFLMLFVFRAVAGGALCELNAAHQASSGASHATRSSGSVAAVNHDAQTLKAQSQAHPPSDDRDEHACEAPVYLIEEPAAPSAPERSPKVDAITWSYAPAGDRAPRVAALSGLPQSTHPPPLRAPLDIAPRLRI